MRKNRMMRLASTLLVLTLLTTCAISGTFAKYTTSVTSEDSARVASWGFETTNSMDLTSLFLGSYTNVASKDGKDVIAPGTTGSAKFSFAYDETGDKTGPEVAYAFNVTVVASCDDAILNNSNIKWKLDTGNWGSWNDLIASISNLSGSTDGSGYCQYAPNTLPVAFGTDDTEHTISWLWAYDEKETQFTASNNDNFDTAMGNDNDLADCSIKITITATQVD